MTERRNNASETALVKEKGNPSAIKPDGTGNGDFRNRTGKKLSLSTFKRKHREQVGGRSEVQKFEILAARGDGPPGDALAIWHSH
jgi:hypothetical protein